MKPTTCLLSNPPRWSCGKCHKSHTTESAAEQCCVQPPESRLAALQEAVREYIANVTMEGWIKDEHRKVGIRKLGEALKKSEEG